MIYDLDLKIGMLVMALAIGVMVYSAFEGAEYKQKCKDAGGVPARTEHTCFRPSAIMKVE